MRSPVDLVAGANVVVPKKRPPNMGLDIEFFAASTPYGASAHPNGALDGPKLPYKRLVKLTAKKSVKRFQKKLRSIKGAEATRVLTRQRGGGSGAPRGGAETVGAGLTIDPFDASASNGGADGPSSIAPNAARHATPHLALYHKWEKDLDDMQLGSLGDADAQQQQWQGCAPLLCGGEHLPREPLSAAPRGAVDKDKGVVTQVEAAKGVANVRYCGGVVVEETQRAARCGAHDGLAAHARRRGADDKALCVLGAAPAA